MAESGFQLIIVGEVQGTGLVLRPFHSYVWVPYLLQACHCLSKNLCIANFCFQPSAWVT